MGKQSALCEKYVIKRKTRPAQPLLAMHALGVRTARRNSSDRAISPHSTTNVLGLPMSSEVDTPKTHNESLEILFLNGSWRLGMETSDIGIREDRKNSGKEITGDTA
jgi:hypothetical protein